MKLNYSLNEYHFAILLFKLKNYQKVKRLLNLNQIYLQLLIEQVQYMVLELIDFIIMELQWYNVLVLMKQNYQKQLIINQDKNFLEQNNVKLNIPANMVNIKVRDFCFELKPITKNKSHFECVCTLDPQMPYIPAFVLNFSIRKLGSYLFSEIIKCATNFKGSPWEQNTKLKENSDFYDWVEKEVNQYFEKQNNL